MLHNNIPCFSRLIPFTLRLSTQRSRKLISKKSKIILLVLSPLSDPLRRHEMASTFPNNTQAATAFKGYTFAQ